MTETNQKPEKQNYDAHAMEAKWRDHWVDNETYKWNPNESRENSFVIDTPPPYVSGKIHIGHAYSYTQTDIIARFNRMQGKNVFYPLGWDDNGLPTERQVEKQENIRAADMPRHEFIALCMKVVTEHEIKYRQQFQTLGLSVDWSQGYQTIGDHARRMSQASVIDLFHKGELYRTPQPSLWDPADQTAIAQSEIEEKELPGTMWEIPFTCEDGSEIVIATTRPELLGACVALMVSPEHPSAGKLAGQTVTTPLYGVRVPVIADDKVDPEKGTGAVMCCTFGDVTDIEWWRKHKLATRVIVDKRGRITDMPGFGTSDWQSTDLDAARAVASQLTGLTTKQAKAKIVEIIKERELLRGETPVMRMVPCAERSGAPLEIIEATGWFVKVLDKKAALIEMGRQIKWTPEFMRIRFEQWTEGLKWDWNISRQRYFGVPLPFWYSKRPGEEGKILPASYDQLPVDPLHDLPHGYEAHEVERETDTMDTWATSSLTPQISSHGLNDAFTLDAERHAKLYPAHMRPQAHEIIRTWAFYTIVKSYLHNRSIPWETAAISGWCLAEDKTKMSKSKGNVIEPLDLIAEHGADVVRYWASTAKLGQDTAFDKNQLKIGRRLQTKLWNAARFASLQLQGFTPTHTTLAAANADITAPLDRWIATRLSETIATATKHHLAYDYADALRVIEDFFWKDFCDNYLELVKARIYNEHGDDAGLLSARTTIYFVLEAILKLFAPVMPHLCEELYSTLYAERYTTAGSIHARGMWPTEAQFIRDDKAAAEGELAIELVALIRKGKTNQQASIKAVAVTQVSAAVQQGLSATSLNDIKTATSTGLDFTDSFPANTPLLTSDDGKITAYVQILDQAA